MRLHITVSDKDANGETVVYADSFVQIKIDPEDACVWATNCMYQVVRYVVSGSTDHEEDEVEVVDAKGNPTSRAKPLKRDLYLVSVSEDADIEQLKMIMMKAFEFAEEQADQGIALCRDNGLELQLGSQIEPDVAIMALEDIEKMGCKARIV
jgi:hypothetical protein